MVCLSVAVILRDFGLKGNVRLGGVFAAPAKRSHLWGISLDFMAAGVYNHIRRGDKH